PAGTETDDLRSRILAQPKMEGLDLACGVSTDERYVVAAVGEERFHVLAYDFGVKAHSPKLLAERGCRVTVIPSDTTAEEILAAKPDGL
ncbi:MAG TPA: carbamoyl phosphate synthase small subunit, partial [Gemmatimonadetes bacterium]|nr:carbamoyl phosphate synthase small subunit [Gemmatimonadota bacterium]